jgi:predicted transcriptional regulator
MDFSPEDLFDAVDREVKAVLDRAGVVEPPVDALHVAMDQFDVEIRYAEDEEDVEMGRFGPRPPRRRSGNVLTLREDQTPESQHAMAARIVARHLLPPVLTKLGIAPGTENKAAQMHLYSVLVPRLLLPTRWFEAECRKAGYDLAEIKGRFPTAHFEAIALRWLDLDDPVVVAILDVDTVQTRKSNRFPVTKKLTAAEEACAAKVRETSKPVRVRTQDWTAWGWPTKGVPFGRIVLRAVPDEV